MKIGSLGHVVLCVKDLARSEAFYHELLGISISVRAPQWSMTFLSLGQHHDVALLETSDAEPLPRNVLGVDHVAFKLTGGLPALAAAKQELEAAGVAVATMDHVVTKSLYLADPDGNKIEIFVDGDEGWREDPQLILSEGKALEL